jgi:fatty acid-binding protein DegV
LGLKPILTLYEGKVEPVTAVASRSKAIARLRSMTINGLADGTHAQMGVFYTGVPDEARRLADDLSTAIKPDYMLVCEAGPIIAVYTGPNALGIFSYCDS